jgi:hypothetical protein
MQRLLQPEILDSLPSNHPAALHNRRDLRIINNIAGSYRWITRKLPPRLGADDIALEVGAGTGELGLQLQRSGVALDGLDLWPRPENWPARRAWHVADLRNFDGFAPYAAVCGNLIFHQFSHADLAIVGSRLGPNVRVILACEPARRRFSQILYRVAGPLLGANYVSLHDARVSIAAGFRDDELPRALGLDVSEWHVRQSTTLFGIYRMIAVRRS